MLGFIGGGVNNDNLLFAAAAGVLLALAIGFRRGLTLRTGVGVGACMAVGLLAKATMIGLLPGIVVGGRADGDEGRPGATPRGMAGAAAAGAVVAGPVPDLHGAQLARLGPGGAVRIAAGRGPASRSAAAFAPRPSTLSGHLSYLWQFYLPRLEVHGPLVPGLRGPRDLVRGFIGRFGWLDYGFPGWVYDFGLVAGACNPAWPARS